MGKTSWDRWGPEIVTAVERLRAFDRDTADNPALADHLENTLAALRRHASLHPRIWFEPRPAYFAAFKAVSGMSDDDEAEAAAYRLLDGEENTLTRLVDGLYELARTARAHPAVAALVRHPPPHSLERLSQLPEASSFRRQLHAFLAVYGERIGEGYGSEMTVLTPTWQEEPARLFRLATPFLDPAREAPAQARARARQEREAHVAALCAACEDETAVAEFRHQLAYARKSLAILEEHNHWIEQATGGQLRLAIMAAAARLVERGVLNEPDDVFWLTFNEISAALRAGTPDSPLTDCIRERQARHAEWSKRSPPPILGLPPADLPSSPQPQTEIGSEPEEDEENGRWRGLGASPGVVEGQARVIPKAAHQVDLEPGDILVAQNAGPLWTPFFPILGGLVLEEGSLGQHAAVTAREYGIPAVITLRDATRRIPDGEMLAINGTTGTVTLQANQSQE